MSVLTSTYHELELHRMLELVYPILRQYHMVRAKTVKSTGSSLSLITLKHKCGHTDLHDVKGEHPSVPLPDDVHSWEDLEGKILRVLNYKYYEKGYDHSYMLDRRLSNCSLLNEKVKDHIIFLASYDELSADYPNELRVLHTKLQRPLQASDMAIIIRTPFYKKIWYFMKRTLRCHFECFEDDTSADYSYDFVCE